MKGTTAAAILVTVAVVAGGGVFGYVEWKKHHTDKKNKPKLTSAMRTHPANSLTMSRAPSVDNLGLSAPVELFQQGRMDKGDMCAWAGCTGELDGMGRCTGCPQ